jgi:hypothetical protein
MNKRVLERVVGDEEDDVVVIQIIQLTYRECSVCHCLFCGFLDKYGYAVCRQSSGMAASLIKRVHSPRDC